MDKLKTINYCDKCWREFDLSLKECNYCNSFGKIKTYEKWAKKLAEVPLK